MYRWENRTRHNREIEENLILAFCFIRILSIETKSNCSNAFFNKKTLL